MHGLVFVLFNSLKEPNISFNWKTKFDFQDDRVVLKFKSQSYIAEKISSKKFASNSLNIENEDCIIIIEGIILNINEIITRNKIDNISDFFVNIIKDKKLINQLKGNFCGVVYDKKSKTCIAFNNQAATKKIYFYNSLDYVVVSTDLFTISNTLKQLGVQRTPDIEAAYYLLSSGFMHDNKTLLNEAKQIRAGEIIEFQRNLEMNASYYFHLDDINENNDTKEQIIEKLDSYFSKALDYGFEFDNELKLDSLVTLSGGLDSRLVSLYAFKKGYRNQQIINFSEFGYADQKIAAKIASDYGMKINYYGLGPDCLNFIDETVGVNDGLTLYLGSALLLSVVPKIEIINSGLLHTGVLGDAILGSYLKSIEPQKAALHDGNYSPYIPDSAVELIKHSINKYDNEEKYKFYNRGFNGINNGILYYDLITESYSPFLDFDFMSYALSIPRKFRYQERIYIDWMQKKHPDVCNYIWENIGCKPTNNQFIRKLYRYKRAVIKRLPVKSMWKNNMAPEQLWYNKSQSERDFMNKYFLQHIDLIDFDNNLKADLQKVFGQNGINEKSQALTYLSAYKLLFLD